VFKCVVMCAVMGCGLVSCVGCVWCVGDVCVAVVLWRCMMVWCGVMCVVWFGVMWGVVGGEVCVWCCVAWSVVLCGGAACGMVWCGTSRRNVPPPSSG
jgi:hypothetical protein